MEAEWLNSFHIYCFTLISGYIFCFQKSENKIASAFFSFIGKKAKRLLLPYAIVSVFWAAPIYMYFYKCSWKDLCINFVLAKSPSQLWFLFMLFWLFLFFYFVPMKYIQKSHIMLPLLAIMYYLSTVALNCSPNFFQILMAFRYALFFYLGMYIYVRGIGVINKLSSLGLLVADVISFGMYGGMALLFHKSFITLELIANIVGSVTIFIVLVRWAKRLCSRLEKSAFCSFVINNNFYCYLLHQQIIFFVITFLNGKIPPVALAVCNFVLSMTVSLAVIWLYKKICIMRRRVCKGK